MGGLLNTIGRFAGDALSGLIPKPAPTPAPQPTGPMGPGGDPSGTGIGQARQAVSTINPGLEATRDVITKSEGTWNPETETRDYAKRYGDKSGVSSLDVTQPHPLDVRGSPWGTPGVGSNASGAYQFLDSTWSEMNQGVNAPMTPENQDAAMVKLLDRRGYDPNKSFESQYGKLNNEWVSIPRFDGGTGTPGQHVNKAQDLIDFYKERVGVHTDRADQEVEDQLKIIRGL